MADTVCVAVKIADGDSFSCRSKRRTISVRLEGIDAPEKGQAYSKQSRQALNKLIYKQKVTLKNTSKDKYGRTLATVYSGSLNVNLTMIENGYAWHYKRYSHNPQYAAAQQHAQQHRRGLWSDKGRIIQPEDWRKKR